MVGDVVVGEVVVVVGEVVVVVVVEVSELVVADVTTDEVVVVGPASAGLAGKPLANQPADIEAAASTATNRCTFTRRSYGGRGTRTRKALARTLTENECPRPMTSPSSWRHSSASELTSMRAPW